MATPSLRMRLMPLRDHLRLRMGDRMRGGLRWGVRERIDVRLRGATRRTRSRRVSLSTRARIPDMYVPSLFLLLSYFVFFFPTFFDFVQSLDCRVTPALEFR